LEQALENVRDGIKTVTFPLLGDIVAMKKTKKQKIQLASSHEYLVVIEKRSFGRHFRALEKRNYIAMCEPCKYPSQCDLCRTLEDVRNTYEGSNIIQGLNDGDVRYKSTGLQNNGFVLEQLHIKSTAAFDQELSNLNSSQPIKGKSFQNMGQDKHKSKGKASKMLIPSKNKTSSQTVVHV
jgi:hypothetical protein